MKKKILIVLLICTTLLAASCGKPPAEADDIEQEHSVVFDTAPSEESADSDPDASSVAANERDGSTETNNVAAQVVCDTALMNLDKSPKQITENMDQFGYNWSLEYEFIDGGDAETYHVFSDIDGISVCTLYGTYLYDLLPEGHPEGVTTIRDLETLWNKNAKESFAGTDDYYCYEFDFGEIAVQVSAGSDGTVDSDFPNAAVYKSQGEFIDAIGFVRTLLEKKRTTFVIRSGVLDEVFSQYISVLGTPLDVIAEQMTALGKDEYNGLRFETDGVEYRVNYDINQEQICDIIIGPAANVLSNIEETINMTYLKNLGLAFRWECFDGYRYWYSFDDAYIYIESDPDDVVGPEDSVVIKPRGG
jgi:hypothetical protein